MRKQQLRHINKTVFLACCMVLAQKHEALAAAPSNSNGTNFTSSPDTIFLAQNQPDLAIPTEKVLPVKGSSDVAGERLGQAATESKESPFGLRSGRYHAFLDLKQQYSDNINNTPDNELDDWTTVISPGVWISLPAQPQITFAVNTSNTSPGGLSLFLERPEAFSRYQFYLMYGAIVERYDSYSERDNTKQTVDGFLQYNLRGGLSMNFFNKFLDSQNPMGVGDSTEIDKFKSNLLGSILNYDLSEKFEARADVRRFDLDYERAASNGRDRTDNSLELYFFYKYSPKTQIFLDYEYVDISYDISQNLDAVNHTPSLGLRWMPTEKTKIIAKGGSVTKRFDDNASGDVSRPSFDLQAFYSPTVKTQVNLSSSYKLGETTVATADYSEDFNVAGAFSLQMTEKVRASISASYTVNDFSDRTAASRTDKSHSISPILQYKFRDWLTGGAGYTFQERSSNLSAYDYTNNTVYVQLAAGM